MFDIITILFYGYILFYLAVLWKFAVKVDKPGWSLFIPIYSNFVWCDIVKLDTIWCILSFAPSIILRMCPGNIGVYALSSIFSLVVSFNFCYSLARRFNKGIGYAIGLLILNPVFLAILTFNKKCYYYRGW